MKAKFFVRAIALTALATTLLLGSTMLASAPLVSVELCVGLQGSRSTGWDEPISYDLIASDSSVTSAMGMAEVVDPGTGCFDTPTVAVGTYEIVFKSVDGESNHMTNRITPVTIATQGESINLMEDGAMALLLEGDANGDNLVNDQDFSIFVSTYNAFIPICATSGNANWDARADFNQDGCVNDQDFSIFVSNYNAFIPNSGDDY